MAEEFRLLDNVKQIIAASELDGDDCWVLGGPVIGHVDILTALSSVIPLVDTMSDIIHLPCRLTSGDGLQTEVVVARFTNDSGTYGRVYVEGTTLNLSAQEAPNYGYLSVVNVATSSWIASGGNYPRVASTGGESPPNNFLVCPGGRVGAEYGIALGYNAQALADSSVAIGRRTMNAIPGSMMFGVQRESSGSRPAWFVWCGFCDTSGTTPDSPGYGDFLTQFQFPQNQIFILKVKVIGRRYSPSFAIWTGEATVVVYRASGGSAQVQNTPTFDVLFATGGVAPTVRIDNPFYLNMAGASGETWHWSASIEGLCNDMVQGDTV